MKAVLTARTGRTLGRCARALSGQKNSMSTITGLLDQRVAELPHREVLRVVHQDIRWSYADLQRHSTAMAYGLSELGFRQGDVLACWLPNDSEQVVALFAAARIGAVLAPVDVGVTSEQEVAAILNTTGCRGMLYGPTLRTDGNEVVNGLFPQLEGMDDTYPIVDRRYPNLRHIITSEWDPVNYGVINFKNMLMYDAYVRDAVKATASSLSADTPVCQPITCLPGMRPAVGAPLTHKALLDKATEAVAANGITDADKLCLTSPSPLGLPVGTVAAMQTNAPLVLATSDVDEEAAAEVVATEGVTKSVTAF